MTGTNSEQTRWQEKLQSIPQRSKKFVIALTKAMEKNVNSFSNKIAQSVETEKGLRQLGPSCFGEMPAEVCEVLQMHNVDDSVFFGTEKEWEAWGSKPTAWPCKSADWDTWVWRVERKFGEVWKRLGVYDAIIFSTVKIPCDRSLLAAALCFWSSATNSLELRFGALSPTMIDVAAIVGLSPHGHVVDSVFCDEKYEVDLSSEIKKRGKGRAIANFGSWIRFFSKGKVNQPAKTIDGNCQNNCVGQEETVTRVEHAAFLACWLCKFILCTQSKKVTTDSYRLAEALASDKIQASSRLIALGPYMLAHLYRCLHHIVTEGMNPNVGGPLWLFQLWLQTYFSKFRQPDIEFTPAGILGSQLASLPLPSHSAEECFGILFRSPVFSEKEFAVCFSRKYPSYIAVNMDHVSLGDEANGQTAYLAWKSAISMRDLFWGAIFSSSLKCGVELYFPAYFSRQLGYYQAVPAPIPESSNRYSSLRAIFTDKKTITQNNLAYEYNLKMPMRSRVATSQCSAEYEKWWAKHVASRFAQDVEKAKESALARNPWAREKNKTTKETKRSNSSTKASATNGDQPVPTKCANPKRRRANKLAKDDSTVSSATHSPLPKHIESQRDQSSDSEEDMVRPKRNRPTNSVQSNIFLSVSNEVEDSAGNLCDEAYEAMSDVMAETEVNQVVQKNTLKNEMDPLTMDTPNRCPPQVSRNEPVNVNVDLRTPPPMKDVSSMKVLTDSAQHFSQTLISTSKEAPLLSEKSVSANEPNDDQPVDEQGFEATFQLAGASVTLGPPGERTEQGEVPEVVDPLSAMVVYIPQEQLAGASATMEPSGERTEQGKVPEVVDPLSALVVFIPQEQLAVVTEVQNPTPTPQTLEEIGDRERQEGATTPIREQPLETPMVLESTVLPSVTADAPSLSNLTLPIEERLRQLLEPETLLESVEMAKYFLGNLANVNLEDAAVIEKGREYTLFLQAHVTGDELDTLATLTTKLEALPNAQKSANEKTMAVNQQVTQCRSLEAMASQFQDRLQQRWTSISACEAKLKELECFKASIEAKIATVQTHLAQQNEILAQEITAAEELRHSLISTKGEVKKATLEAEDKIVECQRLILDIASLARRL